MWDATRNGSSGDNRAIHSSKVPAIKSKLVPAGLIARDLPRLIHAVGISEQGVGDAEIQNGR